MNTKTYLKLKNNWILICSIALLTILGGCAKTSDPIVVEGTAKLRIANGLPGSAPQDFYLNTNKIATNLAFGESLAYQTVTSGTVNLFYTATGTQNVNASLGAYLQTDQSYTVFYARSSAGQNGILGLQDDTNAPQAGRASVRFINLNASSTATINISVLNGSQLISGLAENAPSVSYAIDPAIALTATFTGTTTLLTVPAGTFVAGKSYIVWFTGTTAADFATHIITT
ncbi:DUF4397 domain-containing protein [Pedobacter duraquae]|uniref:Uncharacterized protein DUF4397 n=1 Tax=Pedobacter duraquae TaxID=425511 RepID=A0A4R6ILR4_9SPHI|nr:DUF4397 domain-containing protein [Pedobacter duraquae]TDO23037.1 uncharacterized protein DUF4397 [Pedobacter duraquae]